MSDQVHDEFGLTQQDKDVLTRYIGRFLDIVRVAETIPETIWHYTNAEGLVGIVREGVVRATHVSCLNDSLEHVHLSRLVAAEAGSRTVDGSRQKEAMDNLEGAARARLASKDSAFVTCFTTEQDDLSQWRGYGGQQVGFAIEFDTRQLLDGPLKAAPPNTLQLLRMNYDENRHRALAREIVDQFSELAAMFPTVLSDGFLREYGDFLLWLYATVKHYKFKAEHEIRLFSRLNSGKHTELKFRSKNTLLARYLELDLTVGGRLPIKSIMVGPGGDQATSRISVGDLLASKGYPEPMVPVTVSQVPFRVP